jgi:hypothetical protein
MTPLHPLHFPIWLLLAIVFIYAVTWINKLYKVNPDNGWINVNITVAVISGIFWAIITLQVVCWAFFGITLK